MFVPISNNNLTSHRTARTRTVKFRIMDVPKDASGAATPNFKQEDCVFRPWQDHPLVIVETPIQSPQSRTEDCTEFDVPRPNKVRVIRYSEQLLSPTSSIDEYCAEDCISVDLTRLKTEPDERENQLKDEPENDISEESTTPVECALSNRLKDEEERSFSEQLSQPKAEYIPAEELVQEDVAKELNIPKDDEEEPANNEANDPSNEVIVPANNDGEVKSIDNRFLWLRGQGRNVRLRVTQIRAVNADCQVKLPAIRFENVKLQGDQLKHMEKMMDSLQTLVFHKCGFNDDFYDNILHACKRLKRLIISDSHTFVDASDNKWLRMAYPHLTCVQICSIAMVSFREEEWKTFFRQNQQIESLALDHWYSTKATDRPINVIMKNLPNLTHLFIAIRGIQHLNGTFYDLSVLCQVPHFQHLELQFTGDFGFQHLILHSKILIAMPALKTIHLSNVVLNQLAADTIAKFTHLKRLNLVNVTFDKEIAEKLSTSLVDLEEIYCNIASNDMTPFIRNSTKLSLIELASGELGEVNLGEGINWLNEERAKLSDASHTTIHIKSEATKKPICSTELITVMRSTAIPLYRVPNSFIHL